LGGNRLAGTRSYLGRSVYVLELQGPDAQGTAYVDKRTFEPLVADMTANYVRTVNRTVVFKTLPATKANFALASLPTANHAKTVPYVTPHVRELYKWDALFPRGWFG
jgi:hypothetical protein